MIPKKIHYCWFGGNPKSELILHCIESWKRYLPDYEIIEWNEENFEVGCNPYVQEAYKLKKWAFVSDYARLYALHKHGGVYLDTDVEVYKSFDCFLSHGAFTGFEDCYGQLFPIISAVIGAEKNHKLIKHFLDQYKGISFIKDGKPDLTTNVLRMSEVLKDIYHIEMNNQYQTLKDDVHIYPSTYFCIQSNDSFAHHHMDSSWHHPWKRRVSKTIRNNRFLTWIYSLLKKAK